MVLRGYLPLARNSHHPLRAAPTITQLQAAPTRDPTSLSTSGNAVGGAAEFLVAEDEVFDRGGQIVQVTGVATAAVGSQPLVLAVSDPHGQVVREGQDGHAPALRQVYGDDAALA